VFEGATSPGYLDHPELRCGEPAYCCRYCRTYFPVRVYGKHPRECPIEGCDNPNGFGRYADTPRPRGRLDV
jgi:hypothetical protein